MTSKQKAKQRHKANLFVLSAPSGTGKTTLVNQLKNQFDNLVVSISYTTRSPRKGEKHGIDYFFIDEKEFKQKISEGFFAEWALVYDNYYGTSKQFIDKNLAENNIVLLTIDTQGALRIKKKYPDAILIGILPPSIEEQKRRLEKRGDTEENIRKRLMESSKERKILIEKYQYRFINRNLEKTAEKIASVIKKYAGYKR
ncbi:MAG TPA: guanylate kinase [bacterium]|nr:guanylate kinase [bacterium]HOL34381.1 guanylate kinase [bacterium]HPP07946.1 guanylate kinase [bacterium]